MFYVVDTNVWLLKPDFYESYRDGVVVIPTTVIQELDKHKGSFGALGTNARLAARLISKVAAGLRVGPAAGIVELPEGRFLIKIPPAVLSPSLIGLLDLSVNDDKIIACAIACKDLSLDDEITVVSNDVNVRSKTLVLWPTYGIDAIEFTEAGDFKIADFYKVLRLPAVDEVVAALFEHKLFVGDVSSDLFANQPFFLNEVPVRVSQCGSKILPVVRHTYKEVRGFKTKNDGQVLLADAMINSGAKIVACCGRTGSGKSLTVLATALELLKAGKYKKIRLFKPVQAMGAEIGFLSGDYSDKVAPIRATFASSFEELGEDLEAYEKSQRVVFDVPVYQRGFTFESTIIIIDEAQLMEPGVLKGLITRAHESSIVICLGDTRQATDNRFLNENYNGLSNLINRLQGQDFFSVVYLDKSERATHLNIIDELL